MQADVYIMCGERHEAVDAYGDFLSVEQKEYLRDTEADFRLILDYQTNTSELLLIEDEG